ncbi:type II secretion system protein [Clostridium sp. UBA5119]|uniref:type II secretion system protein n=1 Tax=Clostridium sp. UBA5119 TaxID=1946366 RepID=UPI0032165DA7
MIKRTNNKNKKGFTLIELIIVLAVMAIIALIAIPNFAAVRNNSKVKADLQSCETIKRTVLMLVSDETVTVTENTAGTPVSFTTTFNSDKKVSGISATTNGSITQGQTELVQALAEVKEPQGKVGTGKDAKEATTYEIKIGADGYVEAVTAE